MSQFEIFNSLVLLFIAIMVFIGVMWMGGTLIGYGGLSVDTYYGEYKPMIIILESMTPTIEVNGLLYVDNTPFKELKVGDIILFNTVEYGLVSHRIIEDTGMGYKTKGDNNKVADKWLVTDAMYKGKIVEIHNEFAPLITLLFGDLDNLSLSKLFLGFLLIALFITFVLLFLKEVYDYIFVYFFLRKCSNQGGKCVIEEYYPFLKEECNEKEIEELFDKLSEKKLKNPLKIRYDVLNLHNILIKEQRLKRRYKNVCEIIRKDLK